MKYLINQFFNVISFVIWSAVFLLLALDCAIESETPQRYEIYKK